MNGAQNSSYKEKLLKGLFIVSAHAAKATIAKDVCNQLLILSTQRYITITPTTPTAKIIPATKLKGYFKMSAVQSWDHGLLPFDPRI